MELHAIADIFTGFAFREAIEADEDGAIAVLQARDMAREWPLCDTSKLIRTSQAIPASTGYLRKGDVVLVARGMKASTFRANVFMGEQTDVVASSSLHIIRVSSPAVLPEYLAIYLNTAAGQNAISQILTGSYVSAVPKSELSKINIAIPSIKDQGILVALHKNLLKRVQILLRKRHLGEEIFNAVFNQTIS